MAILSVFFSIFDHSATPPEYTRPRKATPAGMAPRRSFFEGAHGAGDAESQSGEDDDDGDTNQNAPFVIPTPHLSIHLRGIRSNK